MISAHDALLLFALGLVYVFVAVALAAARLPGSRRAPLELQTAASADNGGDDLACAA